MSGAKLRILVSGTLAGDAGQGGATWAVLQYVLGLTRLGHDVLLVEPVAGSPDGEVERYFQSVVAEFGLDGRAVLLVEGTHHTIGVPHADLLRFARSADLLVNTSGLLADEALLGLIARRVFLDLDPGFTQLWHEVEGIDMGFDRHTHFVSVGGIDDSPRVPSCGRRWLATLPPVVLDYWPTGADLVHDALTTVGNWRSYGSIEHQGVRYGQKAHSLREFVDLPARTRERFLLALAIHPDERSDLDALTRHGWRLADPAVVTATPHSYRDFVSSSRAEFGLAKSGYVQSRSGWFSDRSACYLASGRPVIAQDTGFGSRLPTGEGLFAFSTADEFGAAGEELRRGYERHSKAARAIAEEHLDSDRVLTSLLDRVSC